MAGCDGWISIKILQLLFATFCLVYKRVTDFEANKLFYFLQKFSREWPLLNNVTWDEHGAIFTDITYGGFIIIILGLIVGQCSGELQRCKKMENFFLITGALFFIAAGSLELAALESVEERLVDNAAILGVFSLVTGFLFIIDWLTGSKRRKREKIKMVQRNTQSKQSQTEEFKPSEVTKIGNGVEHGSPFMMQNGARIPKNAVKLLPSSPMEEFLEPPVIDAREIKTHEGKVKSTESFLRSERGLYPKIRKTPDPDPSKNNFFIPAGYVLLPVENYQGKNKLKSDSGIGESPTPPEYAKIIQEKGKPGYVVIPIDEKDRRYPAKNFHYVEGREKSLGSPNLRRSASFTNISDVSDVEKPGKARRYGPKTRDYAHSEDSSEEHKYPSELHFRPESRHSLRYTRGSKEWRRGKVNEAYAVGKDDDDSPSMSRRSSPYRTSSPEKLRSILRFDYPRSLKKDNLYFPKDVRYDSLDSQKIAEDLRSLKEIAKSDLNLTKNLEKENRMLKELLKQEEMEKGKLMHDLETRKKEEEGEKDRRMSEREVQYFGIKDIKQSHRDVLPKMKALDEGQKIRKGAKEVNESLKEKQKENKALQEAQEFRDLIDERFHFLHEMDKKRKESPQSEPTGSPLKSVPDLSSQGRPLKFRKSDSDDTNFSQSDEEIRLRVETPGSASFKSEALFWLGNEREKQKPTTPSSPGSPGYVLYTAQNWPESPSPEDRFQFSAKEAQQLSIGTPPKTPILTKPDFASENKNSQKLRLLEFEEVPDSVDKSAGLRKGLLVRKVDFPKEPAVEIKQPTVVQGSTSTWKKWLYPKPKLQHTKSLPN